MAGSSASNAASDGFVDMLSTYLCPHLPIEICHFTRQLFAEGQKYLDSTQNLFVLVPVLCVVSWLTIERILRITNDYLPAMNMLLSLCYSLLTLIFFIMTSIHTVLFVVDTSNDQLPPLFPWRSYKRMMCGCVPVIALNSLTSSILWQSWSASVTRLSNLFAKNTNQPAFDCRTEDGREGEWGGQSDAAAARASAGGALAAVDTPPMEDSNRGCHHTRQVPGELLIRTVFVFLIAAARLHWSVFEEKPLFFLFSAAHYLIIRLDTGRHQSAPEPRVAHACVVYLTAAHAFSPFFEFFSRRGVLLFQTIHGDSSTMPPAAIHSMKDDIVVIIWHVVSFRILHAAYKHLRLISPSPFLPRAAASLASLGFLPVLFPNGFLVLHHAVPWLVKMPYHAYAAVVPWCLWTFFVFVHARHLHIEAHVLEPQRQQPRITFRDAFLFLDHAISLSSGLLRRVRSSLLWVFLCSVLFLWLFHAALHEFEVVDFKWAIDSTTQQLLVNATAVWPIPYAIFHKYPHPSALPIENFQAAPPHSTSYKTPIVCSIEVNKLVLAPNLPSLFLGSF
jgi:hypothetical protein